MGSPGLIGSLLEIFFCVALTVAAVWAARRVAEKAGYYGGHGALIIIPLANIVILLYFIFTEWPIQRELRELKERLGSLGPECPEAGTKNADEAEDQDRNIEKRIWHFSWRRIGVEFIVKGRCAKVKRKAFLISIPAAVLWLGSAFFLGKWTTYWLRGNFVPGSDTSGVTLFAFFFACAVATGFGFYATARALLGKSTIRWQVLSLICAFLVLWAVAGH
jgi:hypothetical protein